MLCPACGHNRLPVIRTKRAAGRIHRERQCSRCGLCAETEERMAAALVADPPRGRRRIPLDAYRRTAADPEA